MKVKGVFVSLLLISTIINLVNAKEISVATAAIKYPIMYVNEKNEIVGCDPELAMAVLKKIGYDKVKFLDIGFDGLIPSLNSGKVDMISSGLSITDERKKVIDYSIPYFKVGSRIYVKNEVNNIKSIQDLKGKRLGVTIGTVQADFAEQNEKKYDYKLIVFSNTDEMFLDLTKGKGGVDAIIENEMSARAYIDKTKIKVKAIGDLINSKDWAFGFRKKGQEELIKQVNEVIKNMKKNGELDKIYKKCSF